MKESPNSSLSRIISTALSQDNLQGIEKVLEELSHSVDACGAILWECEPVADLKQKPPTGNLYIFAQWFEVKVPLYKVPIADSANGYAITNHENLKGGSLSIADVKNIDEPTHKNNYLVNALGVSSMFVVPICFDCREGNINASLAVYRRIDVNPFTHEEQAFIKDVAYLIPSLYEAICDKVGKKLLDDVNLILDEIERNAKKDDGFTLSIEDQITNIKQPLNKICERVSQAFRCFETSLFFGNRFEIEMEKSYFKLKGPHFKIEDVYKLFATSFHEWTSVKPEYFPLKSEGVTAWVLVEKKPIRIFNLSTFQKDRDELDREYSDVQWHDSFGFAKSEFKLKFREMLNLAIPADVTETDGLPPMSFMAAPILRRDRLLGVIRCCTAKEAPWFFPDRHLKILEILANLIGRFWNDFIVHLQEVNEAKAWENLIEDINKQNKRVQKQIDSENFDRKELFKEILTITSRTFSEVDILDIRLLDENENLYFAETRGHAWDKGSKIEREQRKNKVFSRSSSKLTSKTAAFQVIETGNVRLISDAKNDPDYVPQTFPETLQAIIAPIGVGNRNVGVLDIRRIVVDSFASNAPIMAELIGRQLGLYLLLLETEKQQKQVFEDTWHQLKSPVRHTFARATALLKRSQFENEPYLINEAAAGEIVSELYMLRGIARKAHKVLVNAGIFTDLAKKGALKQVREGTELTLGDMRKMIYEITTDTKLMLESYRNIRFYRDFDSFDRLKKSHVNVTVNMDYLEQALNCLIDNAGKYSYNDTVVKIFGGEEVIDSQRYFFVAVENEGIEISIEESELFKRRKIRGEWAEQTTDEGSGIGLWITDHIMKAHKGRLVITPTNPKGLTTVRLLFPI